MNRLTKALICGAAGIGTLVGIDAAGAQQRLATPARSSSVVDSAALVETERKPYDAFLPKDCFTAASCIFVSNPVPKSHRLEIYRVACQGGHDGPTYPPLFIITAELLTKADALVRQIDFLEARYTRVENVSVWAISESVHMSIPAGHKLRVSANSGNGTLQPRGCNISGDLVKLQQQ